MNFMKQKYRSVVYIVSMFLILLVVQVVMYGNFFNELKADTEIINDLSRIRGSIQRYTKLELSNIKIEGLNLENDINRLISKNVNDLRAKDLNRVSQYYDLITLETKWGELKSLVHDYHADPTRENMLAAIDKSEECWKAADANVLREQYIVNKTAAYYKYFTLTFGLNLFAIALALYLYKKYIHNSLAASAIHDSLTGIFNKGYFNEYLEYEIARAVRKQMTFSLIMLDIDHFKLVNDTYGHHRGDYALNALAEVVRKCKRNADVLARVGGEEFIVLLPDTKLSDAVQLADRIRKSVEDFSFEEIGKMTVSLGVTEFYQTDNNESLLKRVDSALYQAKDNGRNRFEVIGGEE
ncbi:MAG TPA: GGDEF domain-containing protein [Anaerovoracaceae bacterium]|nr:GGDEF domain-containing protein [Anaerovoracaceae bacterium]